MQNMSLQMAYSANTHFKTVLKMQLTFTKRIFNKNATAKIRLFIKCAGVSLQNLHIYQVTFYKLHVW